MSKGANSSCVNDEIPFPDSRGPVTTYKASVCAICRVQPAQLKSSRCAACNVCYKMGRTLHNHHVLAADNGYCLPPAPDVTTQAIRGAYNTASTEKESRSAMFAYLYNIRVVLVQAGVIMPGEGRIMLAPPLAAASLVRTQTVHDKTVCQICQRVPGLSQANRCTRCDASYQQCRALEQHYHMAVEANIPVPNLPDLSCHGLRQVYQKGKHRRRKALVAHVQDFRQSLVSAGIIMAGDGRIKGSTPLSNISPTTHDTGTGTRTDNQECGTADPDPSKHRSNDDAFVHLEAASILATMSGRGGVSSPREGTPRGAPGNGPPRKMMRTTNSESPTRSLVPAMNAISATSSYTEAKGTGLNNTAAAGEVTLAMNRERHELCRAAQEAVGKLKAGVSLIRSDHHCRKELDFQVAESIEMWMKLHRGIAKALLVQDMTEGLDDMVFRLVNSSVTRLQFYTKSLLADCEAAT